MGGQRYHCPACGHDEVRFHSCGNRHCPKCQALAKERWVAAQVAEVLPVEHFHVVFTLPHAINAVWPSMGVDTLLFACAAQTLLAFARNLKWLGGTSDHRDPAAPGTSNCTRIAMSIAW